MENLKRPQISASDLCCWSHQEISLDALAMADGGENTMPDKKKIETAVILNNVDGVYKEILQVED